jgi:hypothetical protein
VPDPDLDALARQYGGSAAGGVDDLDALASQYGGAPATPERNPYGRTLSGATGMRATPWYQQGIFAGYGPSVEDAIDTFPAVGGLVGGVLGLAGGTVGGMVVGGVPGAVGGAGVGGGAGEAARQHARRLIGAYSPRSGGEAATEIGQQAAIQGASELAGIGLARVGGKVLNPFARMVDGPVVAAQARLLAEAGSGRLTTETAEQAAERLGLAVDMPASALSTSKLVPLAEAWAAKGIGGGKAGERYARATSHLTAMADQTVARASKLTDDSARGKVIANGFDAYKASWIKTKNNLFGEVDAHLPALGERGPGFTDERADGRTRHRRWTGEPGWRCHLQ